MKQERGITTTSVIIYIIVISVVIGILSVISGYFTKQISTSLSKNENARAYTTFMSYFTQDVQEKGNIVEKVDTQTEEIDGINYEINYIAFSNGSQYIYYSKNKSIYKNEVKICENIDYCKFYQTKYGDNKTVIQINFKTGDFDKTGNDALAFYL